MQITYFGTWAALNPNVDTTHFEISDWKNLLYVDAWAWANLTQKVLRWEIDMPSYIFMTHCHSDHLLWLAHLIRIIRDKSMKIICSTSLKEKIFQLMYLIWKWERFDKKVAMWNIEFINVIDWEAIEIYDWVMIPIDINSEKTEQFWFELKIKDKHIVFFWDEAINALDRNDLIKYEWCDWLLCETFCAENQKEVMRPYQKAHITAYDAWKIWSRLRASNMVLSHIAETQWLPRNQQLMDIKWEAESIFEWKVYTPIDGESITID